MAEFLWALAALSLGGAAAAGLLLGLSRVLGGGYAARWRCVGWWLLCLRLAIPVPLSTLLPEQSVITAPIRLEMPADPVVYRYEPPEQGADREETRPAEGDTAPVERPAGEEGEDRRPITRPVAVEWDRTLSLFQLLWMVWLAGVLIVLSGGLVSHWRFLAYVRRWGRAVEDEITHRLFRQTAEQLKLTRRPDLRLCRGLRVPMLAGIFRPVLLLPEGEMEDTLLEYSILHELTHYRRRDIWLKGLALWVRAVHWFDPVMWVMAGAIERDTELACDEGALKALPAGQHAHYGRALLAAAERVTAQKET